MNNNNDHQLRSDGFQKLGGWRGGPKKQPHHLPPMKNVPSQQPLPAAPQHPFPATAYKSPPAAAPKPLKAPGTREFLSATIGSEETRIYSSSALKRSCEACTRK